MTNKDEALQEQKAKFKKALKVYAIDELAYPKFRNFAYRQKMAISEGAHPTNDYQYRQDYIYRNIEAIIAYFNNGERKIIEGDVDVAKLYNQIRKN